MTELAVGSIVTGTVKSITKYGAFVALPDGKSGLVHISEVANSFVTDVHEFLAQGQEVAVKILQVTPEGKINLSVKQALPRPVCPHTERPMRRAAAQPVSAVPAEQSFEDKLKRFLAVSDCKQSELSRSAASKRSGSRRRK